MTHPRVQILTKWIIVWLIIVGITSPIASEASPLDPGECYVCDEQSARSQQNFTTKSRKTIIER